MPGNCLFVVLVVVLLFCWFCSLFFKPSPASPAENSCFGDVLALPSFFSLFALERDRDLSRFSDDFLPLDFSSFLFFHFFSVIYFPFLSFLSLFLSFLSFSFCSFLEILFPWLNAPAGGYFRDLCL